MPLTLSSVQTSFANFIGRDSSVTDSWVAGILNSVQLFLSVWDGNYFSWCKVNGGTFVTADGVGEYDLTSVIANGTLLRTVKAIYKKEEGSTGAFKLKELKLRNVRLYFPDPEAMYGKGIPYEYYALESRSKKIGLIQVPDGVYTFYVDYFIYPSNPANNNLLIPIEWEIVLLTLLKSYFHAKNDDEKKAFSAMSEFKSQMKHLVKDDIRDTEDDEPIQSIQEYPGSNRMYFTEADYPTPP